MKGGSEWQGVDKKRGKTLQYCICPSFLIVSRLPWLCISLAMRNGGGTFLFYSESNPWRLLWLARGSGRRVGTNFAQANQDRTAPALASFIPPVANIGNR